MAYLAHKKTPPRRTLQYAYASGPMVFLGGRVFSYERGINVTEVDFCSSGLPREKLAELHGNLFLETCEVISHTAFLKSFRRSQVPHKSVNISFTITCIKNKLTNLCGN